MQEVREKIGSAANLGEDRASSELKRYLNARAMGNSEEADRAFKRYTDAVSSQQIGGKDLEDIQLSAIAAGNKSEQIGKEIGDIDPAFKAEAVSKRIDALVSEATPKTQMSKEEQLRGLSFDKKVGALEYLARNKGSKISTEATKNFTTIAEDLRYPKSVGTPESKTSTETPTPKELLDAYNKRNAVKSSQSPLDQIIKNEDLKPLGIAIQSPDLKTTVTEEELKKKKLKPL